jgi:HemY protein
MHDWSPVCDSCNGFDTLTWREPEGPRSTAQASSTGAEMLPLLVGSPRAKIEDAPDLSEPVQPHPPGPAEPEGKPAKVREKQPEIAPGMVPRESDYYEVAEPSATVTTPEPEVVPSEIEETKPTVEQEPAMVRPDVDPDGEEGWTDKKA